MQLQEGFGVKKLRNNCVERRFMETEMSIILSSEQRARICLRTLLREEKHMGSVAKTVRFSLSGESISTID